MPLRKKRSAAQKENIFRRDKWVCYLCGGEVSRSERPPHPRAATIDHVIPLARGGHDRLNNIRTAHYECNKKKGAGPYARGNRPYPL